MIGMNRGRMRASVVVSALMIGLPLTGCGGESPTGPPAPAASSPAASGPVDTPPGDATVEVADHGFTEGLHNGEDPTVSYGVVLANDSSSFAYSTEVRITLLDDAGEPIEDTVVGAESVTRRVRAIPPGGQGLIGGNTFVDRAGVASMTVEVVDTRWTPLDDTGPALAPLTASDVRTTWEDGHEAVTLAYTVNSGYPDTLDRVWAEAVFFDAAGKIVGGAGPSGTDSGSHPPGESAGRLTASAALPADTDDSRTLVFLYP